MLMVAAPPVIPLMLHQHADEAAIATLRRAALWQAEGAGMADLRALDLQLEAHLHGLRHAGAAGWQVALALAQDAPEAESLTALAYLACAEDVAARLNALAARRQDDDDSAEAMAAGFCWHGPTYAAGLLPWLHGPGWAPVTKALRQMLGQDVRSPNPALTAALARPMAAWSGMAADPAAGWAGASAQVPALAALLDDPAQTEAATTALRRILGQPPEALRPLPNAAPLPDPFGAPPPAPPGPLSAWLQAWWQAQPRWPMDARLILGGPATATRLRRKAATGLLSDYAWLRALAQHDHGLTDLAPPSAPYPLLAAGFLALQPKGDPR